MRRRYFHSTTSNLMAGAISVRHGVLLRPIQKCSEPSMARADRRARDRAGRVFETTESLMPIVPSGGLAFEF